MKLRKLALAAAAAVSLAGFGSAAQAAWTASFSDVVNGVSGTLTDNGSLGGDYTLTFTIANGAAVANTWITAVDIKAFSSYSSFTFGGANASGFANPPGSGPISSGGAAGTDGCNGSNGGFACISDASPSLKAIAGATYTFTFNVAGASSLNTTGSGAHVGIGFTQADGLGNAGITSQLTSPIPEPETYAMLLAGLGLMGFVIRRRRRGIAAA